MVNTESVGCCTTLLQLGGAVRCLSPYIRADIRVCKLIEQKSDQSPCIDFSEGGGGIFE